VRTGTRDTWLRQPDPKRRRFPQSSAIVVALWTCACAAHQPASPQGTQQFDSRAVTPIERHGRSPAREPNEIPPAVAEAAPREAVPDADPFASDLVLGRAALVREVERRNPGLAAARAAFDAARTRAPQEGALDDPTFSYALGPQSFGSSMVEDAHMVELRQPFPFPGVRGLRVARAEAEADATGFDAETTRLRLAVLACTLYDRAWAVERGLAINDAHETLLAEIHDIALAQYGAGTGARDAVLEAELERAELEHRRIELHAEREILHARINALLHREPAAALPPLPATMDPPLDDVPASEPRLGAALDAQPDARAAAARVVAGERGVSLAEREFLPNFALFGRWDGFWQERPLRSVVGVEIELPLAITRRRAALGEARAELRRARSDADRVADETRLAVTSASLRIHEAQHLLRLFDARMLPAARDRLDTARDRYATGLADFASLLAAERALRRAELGREDALADIFRRRAELARASGDLRYIDEEISR
jgi:outer membrane protein TolC